jgi:hypothetical protein
VSDDTLGNIKVLKWPELPLTSDERNIDGLMDALLEAETAEQIIECRNELLTAWMGWQAQVEPCCGWTSEAPTKAGWYWYIDTNGNKCVAEFDGADWWFGYIKGRALRGEWWSEPIQEPSKPKEPK